MFLNRLAFGGGRVWKICYRQQAACRRSLALAMKSLGCKQISGIIWLKVNPFEISQRRRKSKHSVTSFGSAFGLPSQRQAYSEMFVRLTVCRTKHNTPDYNASVLPAMLLSVQENVMVVNLAWSRKDSADSAATKDFRSH